MKNICNPEKVYNHQLLLNQRIHNGTCICNSNDQILKIMLLCCTSIKSYNWKASKTKATLASLHLPNPKKKSKNQKLSHKLQEAMPIQ